MIKSESSFTNSREYKINALESEIGSIENKNNNTELEVILLREVLNKLFEQKEPPAIVNLSKYTGSNIFKGSGIEIELLDAPKNVNSDINPNIGIVHNTDLLKVINELWGAGAQAVSINGQRICGNTEIVCIGPTIMINKKRIASPFVIKAAGEANSLYTYMQKGHLQKLSLIGIKFNITKTNSVEIPSGVTILLSGG